MPTIEISSQFQTKNERFRVPSPVVRALFGEPPVQLNFKDLSQAHIQCDHPSVPSDELCPWVLYWRNSSRRYWQATRQNMDEDVPLSKAEILEHNRPLYQRASPLLEPEGVAELLQEIQFFGNESFGEEPSDKVHTQMSHEFKEKELCVWKYCFGQRTFLNEEGLKLILIQAASQIFRCLHGSCASGAVICNACNNNTRCELNGPTQFQDHCVGSKHWGSMNRLNREIWQ